MTEQKNKPNVTKLVSYNRQDFLPLFYLKKFEDALVERGYQQISGDERPRVLDSHDIQNIGGYDRITDIHIFDSVSKVWHAENCSVSANFSPCKTQRCERDSPLNLNPDIYLVSGASFYVTGRDRPVKKVIRTLDEVVKSFTQVQILGSQMRVL